MPFSSQPRRKKPAPQGGPVTKPCGPTGSNVVDLPTQKKQAQQLVEKISQKLNSDSKASEKAAFILSRWLTRKK